MNPWGLLQKKKIFLSVGGEAVNKNFSFKKIGSFLISLLILGIVLFWSTYQRPIISTTKAASIIIGLALSKKPISSEDMKKTTQHVSEKNNIKFSPKENVHITPECFKFWDELEGFGLSNLALRIEEFKVQGINVPDALPCLNLPEEIQPLHKAYLEKCGIPLPINKSINECLNIVWKMRGALSYFIMKDENLDKINDPEIIFDRLTYLLKLNEKKFSLERNEEIYLTSEKLLDIGETKFHKVIGSGAFLMSGMRKIPILNKIISGDKFLKRIESDFKQEFDSIKEEIQTLEGRIEEDQH
jgi:hypothetical protein